MRRAVVVGRAAGALAEYEQAAAACDFDWVLVVGMMIATFPHRVDHAVSFHTELLDHWAHQRSLAGLSPVGHFWGARYKKKNLGEGAARCAPLSFVPCVGGSSGFLAAHGVALGALGADRVVLAGVPLTAEATHEGSSEPWAEADRYWPTWERYMPELVGRVRSMSGRTRSALGAPDREFLGC